MENTEDEVCGLLHMRKKWSFLLPVVNSTWHELYELCWRATCAYDWQWQKLKLRFNALLLVQIMFSILSHSRAWIYAMTAFVWGRTQWGSCIQHSCIAVLCDAGKNVNSDIRGAGFCTRWTRYL